MFCLLVWNSSAMSSWVSHTVWPSARNRMRLVPSSVV